PLEVRLDRIVDQACNVELVDQFRLVIALRQKADGCDVDDEQENVRDVELPHALEQLGGADQEAALEHHLRVDEGGGVAGDEDEQVGCVAEAVIARRHPGDDVMRNVVKEDRPVGDTPEQVQAQIAATRG